MACPASRATSPPSGDVGTDGDHLARTAIRDALDATIVRIAADAWLGKLSGGSAGGASPAA